MGDMVYTPAFFIILIDSIQNGLLAVPFHLLLNTAWTYRLEFNEVECTAVLDSISAPWEIFALSAYVTSPKHSPSLSQVLMGS